MIKLTEVLADILVVRLLNITDCPSDKNIGVVTCDPELVAAKALL